MTQHRRSLFNDPLAVASYAEDARRKVPGMADLHRMAALLLAERTADAAHILVVGAGGGLELEAMASAHPTWRFEAVDPSPAMLELARQRTRFCDERVNLVAGTVDYASAGPFDGTTCLLTLHFLERTERLHTLRQIHRRLKPGARLVVAHHAPPAEEAELWLARSVAFGDRTACATAEAKTSARAMAERLPLLSPSEEEALLEEAGFVEVAQFYAALSFRGWVATAGASYRSADERATGRQVAPAPEAELGSLPELGHPRPDASAWSRS